jgi:capsular exopolysaccharide synthesis family protein
MEFVDYLRGIRRRWIVVVAAIVVALVAAWFTTETVAKVDDDGPEYEASAAILNDSALSDRPTGGAASSSGIVGALATIGPVPSRVAEAIGFDGDPAKLAKKVTAAADQETGILSVTATDSDPERAELLANTFAEKLVRYLDAKTSESFSQQKEGFEARIAEANAEQKELEEKISEAGEEQAQTLRRQSDALTQQISVLEQQRDSVVSSAAAAGGYEVIQKATARPATSGGLQAPQTRASRLLLAAVLGLMLGLALALVIERFDSRIRSKQQAERHSGMPVIAEIPYAPRWRRNELQVAVQAKPTSEIAHAFRLLGASLIMRPGIAGQTTAEDVVAGKVPPLRTILITSPGPLDGKTTVVANLAAAFAELGKEVLILSCDFRRPEIEKFFQIEANEVGLAQALRNGSGPSVMNGQALETWVDRVRLVPSGASPGEPTNLLSSGNMKTVLVEAEKQADIVLVDTPPVLLFSDAAHLFPEVDAVLVVEREGRTTTELAERASELLARLGAPVIGIALNASTGTITPGRYARHRYVRVSDEARRGIPSLARHPEKV